MQAEGAACHGRVVVTVHLDATRASPALRAQASLGRKRTVAPPGGRGDSSDTCDFDAVWVGLGVRHGKSEPDMTGR